MKLLLTSAGFVNKSINQAFSDLLQKPFNETSLAFIPTAANVIPGDKQWYIDELTGCQKLGLKYIDIVDISALSKDDCEKRLRKVDVIMIGGGNTFHLMYWVNKSGLAPILKELLDEKIYVGISAGSMILSKKLLLNQAARMYVEEIGEEIIEEGLSVVDFLFRPHLNSPDFPHVREEKIKEQSERTGLQIYALDDQSALKIDSDKIEIISEGQWLKFN